VADHARVNASLDLPIQREMSITERRTSIPALVLGWSLLLAACGSPGSSTGALAPPVQGGTAAVVDTPRVPNDGGRSSWTPSVDDTWQWQLNGTVHTSYAVRVYDIDLFDTPVATIDALKQQQKVVICYFSAGSSESFRPDFSKFMAADLGNELNGYPQERWLDIRSTNVRAIMTARLDLAVQKGCTGVEPDNVDGFEPGNHSGFMFSASDQIGFNTFLATAGHARNLAVALKNDIAQIDALAPSFDFAVNEQCHELGECATYQTFTAMRKPVFNAEYAREYTSPGAARDALCIAARADRTRTLVLPLKLDDSFRFSCDGGS